MRYVFVMSVVFSAVGLSPRARAQEPDADAVLIDTLIAESIGIGTETDSLRRAERFERIAGALAEGARLAAAQNRHRRAEMLAEQYSHVARHGVCANMSMAEIRDDDEFSKAAGDINGRMATHERALAIAAGSAPTTNREQINNRIRESQQKRQQAMASIRNRIQQRHRTRTRTLEKQQNKKREKAESQGMSKEWQQALKEIEQQRQAEENARRRSILDDTEEQGSPGHGSGGAGQGAGGAGSGQQRGGGNSGSRGGGGGSRGGRGGGRGR